MTNLKRLTHALRTDKEYYESWKANIAMAYKDTERGYRQRTKKRYLNVADKHIIANEAAARFLSLLIK